MVKAESSIQAKVFRLVIQVIEAGRRPGGRSSRWEKTSAPLCPPPTTATCCPAMRSRAARKSDECRTCGPMCACAQAGTDGARPAPTERFRAA
ncbi:hypothetical protein GCM10027440_02850 [Nocardiopsis coralliicola]